MVVATNIVEAIISFQTNNEIQDGALTMNKIQEFIDHFEDSSVEEKVFKILKAKLDAVEILVGGLDTFDSSSNLTSSVDEQARRKEAIEAVLNLAGRSVSGSTVTEATTTSVGLNELTSTAPANLRNKIVTSLFGAISSHAWGSLTNPAFLDIDGSTTKPPTSSVLGTGTDASDVVLGTTRATTGHMIHEDSSLVREIYYHMLAAKHQTSLAPLFSGVNSQKRKAVLGQVVVSGSNTIYDASAKTVAGLTKNVMDENVAKSTLNIKKAIISKSRTFTKNDLQVTEKFFNGEEYPYAAILKQFPDLADQSGDDDSELKRFYTERMDIDATMSDDEIADAVSLGFTAASDYGITTSKAPRVSSTGAGYLPDLWNASSATHTKTSLTSRLTITAKTPPLRRILANATLGDNIVKQCILNASNGDIDYKDGIETALAIACLSTTTNANKKWASNDADAKAAGSAAGSKSYQAEALDEALALINRAAKLAGRSEFANWRELLTGDVDYTSTTNTLEHLNVADDIFTILELAQYWTLNTTDAQAPGKYFITSSKNVMTYLENELYVSRASSFLSSTSTRLTVKDLLLPSTANPNGISFLTADVTAGGVTTRYGKADKLIKCLRSIATEEFKLLRNNQFFGTLTELADLFQTPKLNSGTNDSRFVAMFNAATATTTTTSRNTQAGVATDGTILNKLFADDQEIDDCFTGTGAAIVNDTDDQIKAQVVANMYNGELTTAEQDANFEDNKDNLDAYRLIFVHVFKVTPEVLIASTSDSDYNATTAPVGSVFTPSKLLKVASNGVSDLRSSAVFGTSHNLTKNNNLLQALIDAIYDAHIQGKTNAISMKRRIESDQPTLATDMTVREIMEAQLVGNIANINDFELLDSFDGTANAAWTLANDNYDSYNGGAAPGDGYTNKMFVSSMLYKMFTSSATAITGLFLNSSSAWTMDGTAGSTQALKSIRKAVVDLALLKPNTGASASASEMGDFYHAVFSPVGSGGNATVLKKLESIQNAMSLDLEYSTAEQMPYLLENNALDNDDARDIVLKLAQHVHFATGVGSADDDIDVIQAMGTADDTTAAQKLMASKVDSRIETVARALLKNMSKWAVTTTDPTGYKSLLTAISGASGWSNIQVKNHVLLWVAALADPDSASDAGVNGTVYDTDLRPAGLGKAAIDEVLQYLTHSELFVTVHVVSEVASSGDAKIGTHIVRELKGHSFVAITHDTSEIVVPTGYNATTGDATFTIYAGDHL